jgi:small multidrug resistance family-3 protein
MPHLKLNLGGSAAAAPGGRVDNRERIAKLLAMVADKCGGAGVSVARSILLFAVAALFEIGGAWLVWQGVREHRGWMWAGLGVIALGAYGFVATFQDDPQFGRVLAAYGGVFVAGSLAWGMALDGFRPDRWDIIGAAVCLAGVGVIMYAPRGR